MNHLLSIMIFLPTVGALLVLLVKGRDNVRWVALGTTIATFLVSLMLFATYKWGLGAGYAYADPANPGTGSAGDSQHLYLPAFLHCLVEY
jgi:formate hydrogenlyase subunit 3/multisubunit Na+/H+ antiporter MnhD subunit